mgnify:FL=1|jgi:hypothetical protein
MNIKILEAKDMLRTNEEKDLLRKLADGSLDGLVGSPLITSGGSIIWSVIENGIPTRYKRGPGGKIFNGRENEKFEGTLHTLKKCVTDDEKLAFMQKLGYLMKDSLARTYSAKFKGKV